MIINLFDRLAKRLDALQDEQLPALLFGAGEDVDIATIAADRLMGHLGATAGRHRVGAPATLGPVGDLRYADEGLAAHLAVAIARLRKANALAVLDAASRQVTPRLTPSIGRHLMVPAGATAALVGATTDLLEGDDDHAVDRLQQLLITTLAVVANTATLQEPAHR